MTLLVKGGAREYEGMGGSVKNSDLNPWMLLKMQVTDQINFPVQTRIMNFSLNL